MADQGKIAGPTEPAGGDCVVPGAPVPPEEVARYSPFRDPHLEQDISDYVEGQARDESVKHVEKVKSEFIGGEQYDVWDVTTDKGRWWVVSNPTNLYSQAHFQSLDYTLSFHVGLMLRVRSRRSKPEEASPFDEVSRRHEQAGDRYNSAIEAEDFQAVGMQLRECLLSLIATMRRRVDVEQAADLPKGADFIGWSNLLLDTMCGGAGNKSLRGYLKTVAEKTWQLANSLTHDRNAAQTEAYIAIQACDTLIGHYLQLLLRRESGNLEKCPKCSSRNIRSHFDAALPPDGHYYNTCGACGWDNHPGVTGDEAAEAGAA